MQKVAIRDVKDAEAFVIAAIRKSGIKPRREEFEDLIGAGLVILCELSHVYKPRMNGYAKDGCFSGYASRYLPARIRDAFFEGHENITVSVDEATSRKVRTTHPPPVHLSSADQHSDDGDSDGGGNQADDRALAVNDPPNQLLDLWHMPAPLIPTAVTADRQGAIPRDLEAGLLAALSGSLASHAHLTVRVAWLQALDLDRTQIAERLGCPAYEVEMAVEHLRRIGKQL